jgi:hypothetical protein
MNGTYKSNACTNHRGGRREDVDDWVQPFYQIVIDRRSLLDLCDLRTKERENVGGRVAVLQPSHQRMREKAFLGLLFVIFQGSFKGGM